MFGPVISSRLGPSSAGIQINIVGNESPFARLLHPLLNHRVPRRDRFKHRLLDQSGPHISAQRGEMRKIRQQICLRHSSRTSPDAAASLKHGPAQLHKDALLNFDRPIVRGEYLALVFLQLRRRKPLGIHQRLLALIVRRSQREVGLGDLDVISEDRVIANFQRTDPRTLPLALFDCRNRLTARR